MGEFVRSRATAVLVGLIIVLTGCAVFGPVQTLGDAGLVVLVVNVVVLAACAAAVAVAVLVPRRRRRRVRAGGTPPDPLWEVTDVTGRRAGQFVLDVLPWYVPMVLIMALVVWLPGTGPDRDGVALFFALGLAWLVALPAWSWFLHAWWPARHEGQTLGMRRLGLRVVTIEGTHAGLGRHTLRWLLLVVDASFACLPGWLAMATTARHQRVGDMVAGTVVVRADVPLPFSRTPAPVAAPSGPAASGGHG